MSGEGVEDLPSPIAGPLARAAPLEGPTPALAAQAVAAFVELACVRVLSEALSAPIALPFPVESAMRLVMLDEMAFEGWLDLYAALDHCGLLELLGLPSELPPPVRNAMEGIGVSDLLDWFERAPADAPGAVAPALIALTRAARGLSDLPLHAIRRVVGAGDGIVVEHRRLAGTAWPAVRRTRSLGSAELKAGTLAFWDGDSTLIEVPDWLARWSERQMALWLFGGRFVATGEWRYELWAGFVVQPRSAAVAESHPETSRAGPKGNDGPVMPPLLLDAWRTLDEDGVDPNAQTGMITMIGKADKPAGLRRPPPPRVSLLPTEQKPGSVLALRVLTGPDLMRYRLLAEGERVVVGRHADSADFVLNHHQISRANTEITLRDGALTVADLGSTNGTHVQGRPVPGGETHPVNVGDWISVGSILLRPEWLTPERRVRLDTIAAFPLDDPARDPATQLLWPTAVADLLPRSLRASFRDGGTARHAPSMWGILVYVERLAAIHAQHGERIADRVFRDVARVLQFESDAPELWARVGYGEALLACVGVGEVWIRAEASRLAAMISSHPWESPVERLVATTAVGRKDPSEPAQEWLKRLRIQLRERRGRTTRPRSPQERAE